MCEGGSIDPSNVTLDVPASYDAAPPPSLTLAYLPRYLEYEKEHGDAASAAHVKKLAMEFVKNSNN